MSPKTCLCKRYKEMSDFSFFDSFSYPVFISDDKTGKLFYFNKMASARYHPTHGCITDSFIGLDKQDVPSYYFRPAKPASLISFDILWDHSQSKQLRVSFQFLMCQGVIYKLLILARTDVLEANPENVLSPSGRENLVSTLSSFLAQEKDSVKALQKAKKLLAKSFQAKQTHVFSLHEEGKRKFLSWNPGKTKKEVSIRKTVLSYLLPYLKAGKPVFLRKTAHDKYGEVMAYGELVGHSVSSLIMAPILVNKVFHGFFTIEDSPIDKLGAVSSALTSTAELLGLILSKTAMMDALSRDKVTHFLTSQVFNSFFPRIRERYGQKPLTYIAMVLDGYEVYQTFYGEEKSNLFLQEVSYFIQNHIPELLMGYRSSIGTNFGFLLNATREESEKACMRIYNFIEEAHKDVSLKPKFGLYFLSPESKDIAEAESKGYFALKEALGDQQKVFAFYDEKALGIEKEKSQYAATFQKGLKNHEFVLYIQPKYNMDSLSYIGGEVLCRWMRDGKMIPPSAYIPLFESNGLIKDLDHFVLVETCKTLRRELDAGYDPVPLSFNYSRVDFYDETLFLKTIRIIDQYKIPHNRIQIEITESAYIEMKDRMLRFISLCRESGIEVWMDDFGSGYSSLNSLKEMDINGIKLDYYFIKNKNTENAEKNRKVIEGCLDLARYLDLKVIVEGVETLEEASFLHQIGARYIQGYLYGKPLLVPDYEKLITSHNQVREIHCPHQGGDILSELKDPGSVANFLMQDSLLPMALFKVVNGKGLIEISNHSFKDLHLFPNFQVGTLDEIIQSAGLGENLETLKILFTMAPGADKRPLTKTFVLKQKNGSDISVSVGVNKLMSGDQVSYFLIQLDFSKNRYSLSSDLRMLTLPTLEYLFSGVPFGVMAFGEDKKILFVNREMQSLFPRARKYASLSDVFLEWANEGSDPLMETGKTIIYYSRNLKEFISIHTVEMSQEGGKMKVSFFNKIDSRKEEEDMDQSFYARMSNALFGVVEMYTEINLSGNSFQQVHFSSENYFGAPETGNYEESLETHIIPTLSGDSVKEAKELSTLSLIAKEKAGIKHFSSVFRLKNKQKWLRNFGTFFRNGSLPFCSIFTVDVTDTFLRDFDSLTGLLNRGAGERTTNEYIDAHLGAHLGIVLMDIDYFKKIDDDYGHLVGDKVLVGISKLLQQLSPDSFGPGIRFGGDEFGFLVKDPEYFNAARISSLFLPGLFSLSKSLYFPHPIQLSIGLSLSPKDGTDFDDLYVAADTKMYEEKKRHHALRKD